MAQKKVCVTWMTEKDAPFQSGDILQSLQSKGLQVCGGDWIDNLKNMAWTQWLPILQDPLQSDVWLIACDATSLAKASTRYALSLLITTLREERGPAFPIILLGVGFKPKLETLPTLLHTLQLMEASDESWPAKVVAAGFVKVKNVPVEYRFSTRADPAFGQWFEIGPREGTWQGAMFGVSTTAEITHHAVGPKGVVPERAVLEYPLQGMQGEIGEFTFNAWAVQNKIAADESYFIRVQGEPEKIIFGEYQSDDQPEVFVLNLSGE